MIKYNQIKTFDNSFFGLKYNKETRLIFGSNFDFTVKT